MRLMLRGSRKPPLAVVDTRLGLSVTTLVDVGCFDDAWALLDSDRSDRRLGAGIYMALLACERKRQERYRHSVTHVPMTS
jgi:hypothetical protein